MSEATRLDWHQVYELNVIEFLNYICYIQDKNALERQKLKNFRLRGR